jgi:hypothetical protein
MKKISRFLKEAGVSDVDLRHQPKCGDCGIKITSKNWANMVQRWEDNGFGKEVYFCEDCYLKPENL